MHDAYQLVRTVIYFILSLILSWNLFQTCRKAVRSKNKLPLTTLSSMVVIFVLFCLLITSSTKRTIRTSSFSSSVPKTLRSFAHKPGSITSKLDNSNSRFTFIVLTLKTIAGVKAVKMNIYLEILNKYKACYSSKHSSVMLLYPQPLCNYSSLKISPKEGCEAWERGGKKSKKKKKKKQPRKAVSCR